MTIREQDISNRSGRKLSLMRNSWLVVTTSAFIVFGCGGGGTTNPSGGAGSESIGGAGAQGGSPSTGGANNVSGGAPTTGGASSVTGNGGQSATGGTVAVGGTKAGGGASAAGGSAATGGKVGSSAGGNAPTGGSAATGGKVGSSAGGNAPTGGAEAAGGNASTGGATPAVGGGAAGGGATGGASAATGGKAAGGETAGGSTGAPPPSSGPCDIYAAASTPCTAAYSTTRILYSKYTGPLYQVRQGGSNGSGGTLTDIGVISSGTYADGAAQDTACGTSGTCTISKLYDQSGKGNDLVVAKKGCYTGGNASKDDYESTAKTKSVNISGHKVYALYMLAQEGYRNNTPTGVANKGAAQGIYEVADGTRNGNQCCWDFGIASTDNCNQGTMDALFFGTAKYWDYGAGNGPWFMADFEGGVWGGGTSGSTGHQNSSLPSSATAFAFGMLSTSSSNYKIKVGDATTGSLTTANNTALPKTQNTPGGIILGIGGDNSNSSLGTFFEGALTMGQPSDATDTAVFANVQAAGYGK
jgi:non-reducing end alpha-L-arabinofuranosidase